MIKVEKVTVDWSQMPTGLTWLFIGAPKTGKSTQAAKWSERGAEGVLLIDTDLGSDFIDGVNRVTVTSINPPTRPKMHEGQLQFTAEGIPLEEEIPPDERGFVYRSGPNKGQPMAVYSLAEVVFDLEDNWKELGYDTIVIDTVDVVNEWIEDIVNPDGFGLGAYGTDYYKSTKKNMDIMIKLQRLVKKHGGSLLEISHSKKSVEVDGKIQLMPELPRGLASKMCAKADVIGYATIDKKTGRHMISFVGYDERSVGSRLEPLHGKELPFDYQAVKEAITGYKEKKK